MTEHENRNPLADALPHAERSPEALAYEVPVELVRTRARRRRRARTAGAAGAVALVVGGVALAVPPLLRGEGTTPAPVAAHASVAAHAPAECRRTLAGLRAGDGIRPGSGNAATDDGDFWRVTTSLEADAVLRPSGAWRGLVRVDVDAPTASLVSEPKGWTIAGTLVLVQDGAVVAVLDGWQDMSLQQATQVAVDVQPQPFPLDTEIDSTFVSCATGEPAELAPGDYELVATRTLGWSQGDSTTEWVARATSEPLAVTVADDDAPPAPTGPATCGASDDELRDLADPRTNPAPSRLSAPGAPTTARAGERLVVQVKLTNDGPERLDATASTPTLVVVQDGRVVGGLDAVESVGHAMSLDPGGSLWLEAGARLLACSADGSAGPALDPGEYEVWAVTDVIPDRAGGGPDPASAWDVAGGPWRVVVR
ncbi:hypothetical protein ACT17Q_03335 [Cellulomonas sp. CW35]|uniref:hypothetical protein n=1 Tax=Cellulomonas sp. CW35 TaxID=3458249 RepID=UPI004033F3A6